MAEDRVIRGVRIATVAPLLALLLFCGPGTSPYMVSPESGEERGDTPVEVLPVHVFPGMDLQALVDAHPAGTTFFLEAGIHKRVSVRPREGMTFIGAEGAILDGGGTVQYAFRGDRLGHAPPVDNVTIRNLEIRNYATPEQRGAIRAGGPNGMEATGWVVESCEIHHNDGGAIRTGHRMVIRNNHIHHNHQIGIVGIGDDILIEGNEISYNGATEYLDWENGGMKLVMTRGLVVRNNYVHNNIEVGIWADIDNVDVLIEGNRAIDNAGEGILIEISYGGVVRNNLVSGNGFGRPRWLYGAGIMASSTPDVEIYGNTVTGNAHGITGVQQNRGGGAHGPYELKNLYVHDNVITMTEGRTGVAEDIGDTTIYTGNNNRFENNTYNLGNEAHYFHWMNSPRTATEWQAYGHDTQGTFNRIEIP